jgi:hypothetical protein
VAVAVVSTRAVKTEQVQGDDGDEWED